MNYISYIAQAILALSIFVFAGCETTGTTKRIDRGQAPEHSDLTLRDLDEFSSRLFTNMMTRYPRTVLGGPASPSIAAYAIPQNVGRGGTGFNVAQRLIGLQQTLARSGTARFSAQRINSETQKQQIITFARSQSGRGVSVGADFILEQHINEVREYHRKHVVKTYQIILKLIDLRPGSPTLGLEVIAEQETILKQVRR